MRAFSDEELDRAATVSLNFDAPLTCQFFVEDHALRHSYHHLGRIRAAPLAAAAPLAGVVLTTLVGWALDRSLREQPT